MDSIRTYEFKIIFLLSVLKQIALSHEVVFFPDYI